MNVGTLTTKLELAKSGFEKSLNEARKKAWEVGKKLSVSVSAPMVAAGGALLRMVQA
jgi:hypothetical protein